MRDINEVAKKKMARNGLKIAKSLGCAFHFESEFTYAIKSWACIFHTPFLTAVFIVEWLVLETIYLLKKEIL